MFYVSCTGTGYQIELFRMLAGQVGWHTTDYNFVCMTNSDVMTDLMSATGNCSLSATGARHQNLAWTCMLNHSRILPVIIGSALQ